MYPLLNIKNEPKLTALTLSFKAELFIFSLYSNLNTVKSVFYTQLFLR